MNTAKIIRECLGDRTQTEFATIAGVAPECLSRWLHGAPCTVATLEKIANAAGKLLIVQLISMTDCEIQANSENSEK